MAVTIQPWAVGISGDAARQLGRVEVGRVRIIGILDEHLGGRERQAIDKAIAVGLVDRGVHHDRALEAVPGGDGERLAAEFLPATGEPGRRRAQPRVSSTPPASRVSPPSSVTLIGEASVARALMIRSAGRAARTAWSRRSLSIVR